MNKTVSAEMPPRVEYGLPAFGRQPEPLLDPLYARHVRQHPDHADSNCRKVTTDPEALAG